MLDKAKLKHTSWNVHKITQRDRKISGLFKKKKKNDKISRHVHKASSIELKSNVHDLSRTYIIALLVHADIKINCNSSSHD